MTTINFPTSPELDQVYNSGDKSWVWNGKGWRAVHEPRSTDVELRDRATHTGTQDASTIVGLTDWQANPVGVQSINGGQLAGLENVIINGDMRIAQRGAMISSGVNVLTYTLDRWIVAAGGAALTVDQGIDTSAPYNYMAVVGAAGNTAWSIRQRIEARNIRDIAGKTVTISFYLYNSTGNASNANVEIYSAGAVDNFTADTLVGRQAIDLASGIKQTFTLTLTAACANGVELRFASTAGFTSGVMVLHTVQLEDGPVATPFERRPYGLELMLCQRYYVVLGGVESGGGAAPAAGIYTNAIARYPVTMRATPTLSFADDNGTPGSAAFKGGNGAILSRGAPESVSANTVYFVAWDVSRNKTYFSLFNVRLSAEL